MAPLSSTLAWKLPWTEEPGLQSMGPLLPQPAPSRARTLEAGGALGEARPGQSSLSAGALRHRAWAQIQPSHPLLPPSPFAFNLSQHQGLFRESGRCG